MQWSQGIFAPAISAGATAIAAHVGIGLLHSSEYRLVWPNIAAMVGTFVFTAVIALGPLRWRALHAVALAVLIVTPGALVFAMHDPTVEDWRYWAVGAMDPAVAALCIRRRPESGLAAAVLMALGVGLAQSVTGGFGLAARVGASMAVVCVAVAAMAVRVVLDQAARDVALVDARHGRARVTRAAAQEREQEAAGRITELSDQVIQMLHLIASGAHLSPAERDRCLTLEAAARDRLVARDVMSVALTGRVGAARARGVTVDISGRGRVDPRYADRFRATCGLVVDAASPGSRVVAQWRPGGDRLGSILLIDDHIPDTARTALLDGVHMVMRADEVTSSCDQDTTLFEFYRSSTPAAEVA